MTDHTGVSTQPIDEGGDMPRRIDIRPRHWVSVESAKEDFLSDVRRDSVIGSYCRYPLFRMRGVQAQRRKLHRWEEEEHTSWKAVRYIYIVRTVREGGIPSLPGYALDRGAPGISPTERAAVDVFFKYARER